MGTEFTTEKHTRATHTHTHFKRGEKSCQIPSNFHRSHLLLPVRTANRDLNGSNNVRSFARRPTKTMTTTLQKMEKRRTTIKRRRRERRGRRRSDNHRYSTRKYFN